jgi:uncharacterized protein (DUF952 family)
VSAHAVITDPADRILLSRLTDRTARPGWWSLPGGGVDHGEHPRDAVVREVYEEAGLPAAVGDLLDVDSLHLGPDDGSRADDFHAIRIVYAAEVPLDVEPRTTEVDGTTDLARWVGFGAAAALPLVDLARLGLDHALRRHRLVRHLALPGDWAAARGTGEYLVSTRGRTLADEGFVHCSWVHQVAAVAQAFYADVDDLLVLTVDLDRVGAPVRHEMPPGADEAFPHVFGPLPVEAVVDVGPYAGWLTAAGR